MSLDQALKMLDPLREATDPESERAISDCLVAASSRSSLSSMLYGPSVNAIYNDVVNVVSPTETSVYRSIHRATR